MTQAIPFSLVSWNQDLSWSILGSLNDIHGLKAILKLSFEDQ